MNSKLGLSLAALLFLGRLSVEAQAPFTLVHGFTTSLQGSSVSAGVILSNNVLFGATQLGGAIGFGTVFQVDTSGSNFMIIHSFTDNGDGYSPVAGLVLSSNRLYGTTINGGPTANGNLFAVNTDGGAFSNLFNFTEDFDASSPSASLILAGNILYGTTSGRLPNGMVFAINTDGTGFTNLHRFTGGSDGGGPTDSLVLSGDTLYGTAQTDGTGNFGVIFSVKTNGLAYTVLHPFAGGSDGATPFGGLFLSSNILFGTTSAGGAFGNGTIFSIQTNGSGFTNFYNFTATTNGQNLDGAAPYASLTLSGNTLFGTARDGGVFGFGTVFAVTTNGTGFITLHSFAEDTNGFFPQASVVLSGGILYGTASQSTGSDGAGGTVFAVSLAPSLEIARTNNQITLSWPTFATNFTLQTRTNLVAGTWSNLTGGIIVSNGFNIYTNSASNSASFFRLKQ